MKHFSWALWCSSASTAGEGGAANSTAGRMAMTRVTLRPAVEFAARHRHAAFGILLEHALGVVDVAVDDQLPRRGEAHEPEHVTGRERGDEKLLRIGPRPMRCAGRNILLRGVTSELQRLEFDAVRAAVLGGLERHTVPLPLGFCSVNGHEVP